MRPDTTFITSSHASAFPAATAEHAALLVISFVIAFVITFIVTGKAGRP